MYLYIKFMYFMYLPIGSLLKGKSDISTNIIILYSVKEGSDISTNIFCLARCIFSDIYGVHTNLFKHRYPIISYLLTTFGIHCIEKDERCVTLSTSVKTWSERERESHWRNVLFVFSFSTTYASSLKLSLSFSPIVYYGREV